VYPVVRAKNPETAAMGTAYLADLVVGYHQSINETPPSPCASDRAFEPKIGQEEPEKLRAGWYKALERAKAGSTCPPFLR
jgi:glycerol kinase